MNKKVNGFMGYTHTMLSIIILCLLIIIPLPFTYQIFGTLKNNILLFIISIFVFVGGALLPDLDNCESSAKHALGPLGSIFILFMTSTASIIWNIFHLKNDSKPFNQHRYFWHCPIIGIGITLLFYYKLPSGDYTIYTNIKNSIETGQVGLFIMNNATLILFIILAFMSILCGVDMIIRKLRKVISVIPKYIKYILPVLLLVYIGLTTYSNIRILGCCIGVGYLAHCLEDILCDSGVCFFWPIPIIWKKKWWQKIHIPFSIKTGGMVNSIIDIVSTIVAVGLIILVLFK